MPPSASTTADALRQPVPLIHVETDGADRLAVARDHIGEARIAQATDIELQLLLRSAAQIAAPVLKIHIHAAPAYVPGAFRLILPSSARAQLTFQPGSRVAGRPRRKRGEIFVAKPRPASSVSARCSCGSSFRSRRAQPRRSSVP
jgi:hypothetical protein